ncbi:flavin monoamine oxidase family protein [Aureimonas jatrophae]|jgi:monoamine oxidase|uniref:Tryptophan 2-monooxygenase n=1 Tax=Aureimonas jatrophae TaxID=1166073 RepID=A0A1H0ERX9_9HYPH|nr:FAD-dependent oxidoreductase [Aureimonas jatrophae]MBB3950346.1 monoamine oxidase [Aureimonas jatrophae]SDN85110.1 monoamine oxidase [Aureimonas jatrophae]
MSSSLPVLVIGAGAGGLGAARTLHDAGVPVLVIEARDRIGGRAHTVLSPRGDPIDHGCGWLHSATENPMVAIAQREGFTIDRSTPPWQRRSATPGFGEADQAAFGAAIDRFDERLVEARGDADRPASAMLEPGNRWNPLIDAVSTWYSGAELDLVSAVDLDRYDDNGRNWRVREGYGRLVETLARDLDIRLGVRAETVRHDGRTVLVETSAGTIEASAVVVALPSAVLAAGALRFHPALPDKIEAADALPLGLADKLYFQLEDADRFESDRAVFGRTDTRRTASYTLRPYGLAQVECYFGGALAQDLERDGEPGFVEFALDELSALYGSDMRRRLTALPMTLWGREPESLGSYSYARPGMALMRERLGEPVDERLFFAGEAVSPTHYSTAHGAYLTGIEAARRIVAARHGEIAA